MKTPKEDLDEITKELLERGFKQVTEEVYNRNDYESRRIETKAGIRFFIKEAQRTKHP